MRQINANDCESILLGRQGENLATRVIFDISEWKTIYGNGTPRLMYQPPSSTTTSEVTATVDGNYVFWDVTSAYTAISSGCGECGLLYYSGDTLVKSRTWITFVDDAMDVPEGTTPPSPAQSWVDTVIEANVKAQASAAAAAQSAQQAAGSASAASTSETNAKASEESAKASETAAQASQTAAAGSASAAANSATSASAAASAASESAAAAKASEDNAAQSATDAKSAMTAAQTAQGGAEVAQSAAESAASSAATSAGQASVSEQNAAGSASAAAQSASSIGEAERIVTEKASEASSSAANAAASAEAAEKSAEKAVNIAGGDFATKTEAQGYADTAESNAKSYTDQQISSIPTPDVSGQIGEHNTNAESHNDIRDLITGLTNRLNALADSDDTTLDQLSEVVAYIKNNKSLIDGITTSKVNVADIINNLTTNVSNKPLSAAQGVALKALIDAITVPTKVSELENDSGYLTSYTETDPTVPAWAKAETKPTYTADEVGARPNSWMPSASDVGAIPASEKGVAGGVASLGNDGKVPSTQLPSLDYIPTNQKGAANGVATLGADALLAASQRPKAGGLYRDDGTTTVEASLAEISTALQNKADASHTHDDRYYTETEVNDLLSEKAPAYTYGTEDLTAGTSPLETGKLYFVYE